VGGATSRRLFATAGSGGARQQSAPKEQEQEQEQEEGQDTLAPRTTRAYERQFYRQFPQLVGAPQDGEDALTAVAKKVEDVRHSILAVEEEIARTSSKQDEADRGVPDFVFADKKVWVGDHFPLGAEQIGKYVPEGHASLVAEIEHEEMGHEQVMARSNLHQLVQELERQRSTGFSRKQGARSIIFDGEDGVGKSTMLTQLVYWARSNGWLVLFVPDGKVLTGWMTIKRSKMFPGKYDQPEVAEALLHTLLAAHGEQLEQLPVRSPLPKSVREQEFSGKNWRELAQFGVEYEGVAADVLSLFRLDLNSVTEFPVLVVVDDYNLVFGNSFYPDMDDTSKGVPRLPCDKLSLVSTLNDPTSLGLANGTLVAATDRRLGTRAMRAKGIPAELFQEFEPYSMTEFLRHFDFYKELGWIKQDVSSESLNYIYRYTNGHALEVYKYLGMI